MFSISCTWNSPHYNLELDVYFSLFQILFVCTIQFRIIGEISHWSYFQELCKKKTHSVKTTLLFTVERTAMSLTGMVTIKEWGKNRHNLPEIINWNARGKIWSLSSVSLPFIWFPLNVYHITLIAGVKFIIAFFKGHSYSCNAWSADAAHSSLSMV